MGCNVRPLVTRVYLPSCQPAVARSVKLNQRGEGCRRLAMASACGLSSGKMNWNGKRPHSTLSKNAPSVET
jgi:hypothetical protein